jgi:hypothetical protein
MNTTKNKFMNCTVAFLIGAGASFFGDVFAQTANPTADLKSSDSKANDVRPETLIQTLPEGYKIDFQNRTKEMMITEMVPNAETVKNWTEMLTTQIMYGLQGVTPAQFRGYMMNQWQKSCPDSSFANVAETLEQGYPIAVWLQTCTKVASTGKPEITWLKVIQGNDSLYLVQKAFKFQPSEEQITKWTKYLRSVYVCDGRINPANCNF